MKTLDSLAGTGRQYVPVHFQTTAAGITIEIDGDGTTYDISATPEVMFSMASGYSGQAIVRPSAPDVVHVQIPLSRVNRDYGIAFDVSNQPGLVIDINAKYEELCCPPAPTYDINLTA